MKVLLRWLWSAVWLAGMPLHAQTTILWNSDAQQTNLTSTGSLLDQQFQFELGVFDDAFDPAIQPVAQWAAHWHGASRTAYNASTKRFSAASTPTNNTPPFTAGKPAYVWGFRGDAASAEWILFRAATWTWPNANSFPSSQNWWAKDATPLLGTIHANGSPCLMQTAAVTNAAPPTTSWSQWQADTLAGEPLNGPNDDPDHDGTCSLLEYVFGTQPTQAGDPPQTPVAWVDGYLQMTLPRRIDHPATLIVQVSSNLLDWEEGDLVTAVVSNTPAALVVRDLTPQSAAHPQRFMRLKTVLAP